MSNEQECWIAQLSLECLKVQGGNDGLPGASSCYDEIPMPPMPRTFHFQALEHFLLELVRMDIGERRAPSRKPEHAPSARLRAASRRSRSLMESHVS